MHVAYVDESGDAGKNGSATYTLSAVLVPENQWLSTLDGLVGFRRFLRDRFEFPVRAELKANFLLRNGGPHLRAHPLSESARQAIFLLSMRLQGKLDLKTFAIVIDKTKLWTRDPTLDPVEVAWEYLIQRLERFSTKNGSNIVLVHDLGEEDLVRKIARKSRRIGSAGTHFGTGSLRRPFTKLVDDPVARDSARSYLLQLADMDAYAAFRRVYPPPVRAVQVVPQGAWDQLGPARLAEANMLAGGPVGIVVWPR